MKLAERVVKMFETGEMSKKDIEKGGEWYEVAQELKSICAEAGVKCEVKPFDQYQGPYAFIPKLGGSLWGVDGDEYYFEPSRGSKNKAFSGDRDSMIDYLSSLK